MDAADGSFQLVKYFAGSNLILTAFSNPLKAGPDCRALNTLNRKIQRAHNKSSCEEVQPYLCGALLGLGEVYLPQCPAQGQGEPAPTNCTFTFLSEVA